MRSNIVRAGLVLSILLLILSGCKQNETKDQISSLTATHTSSPSASPIALPASGLEQDQPVLDFNRLLSMNRDRLIAELGEDFGLLAETIPQSDAQFQSLQFRQTGLMFLFYNDSNQLPFGVKLKSDYNPLNITIDGVALGMPFAEIRNHFATAKIQDVQLADRPMKQLVFKNDGLVYAWLFEDSSGSGKEIYIYLDQSASDQNRNIPNHWIAWELLKDREAIADTDQRGFYFRGTDEAGGYQFNYLPEQENGAGYVVDPVNGNVYDPISEGTLLNLFHDALILDGYDAAAIAREGGWLDSQLQVFPGNFFGWILLESVDANRKLAKAILVDPVSGEVVDPDSRQSLGNLKQWKSENKKPVVVTFEIDQVRDEILFSSHRVVLAKGGTLILRPADPEFQLLVDPGLGEIVDWQLDMHSDDLLFTGVKPGTEQIAFSVAHMASVRGTLDVTVLD
jgi:hypothetical protein